MVLPMVRKKVDVVLKDLTNDHSCEIGSGLKNEHKRMKPFLFSDLEIAGMAEMFKRVVLIKKALHYRVENKAQEPLIELQRGSELLIWKLAVAVKVAQTQPFKLKYVGNNGTRCQLCGNAVAWSAVCAWDDKFFNRETGEMASRVFRINSVCSNCLEASNAPFLHEAEWYEVILSNRSEAQFHTMGNAKSWQCEFCREHATDSTWVHIPWGKYMLTVAVCEKHFDMVIACNADVPKFSSLEIVESLVKEGSLNPEVMNMMKTYQRKTNKSEKLRISEEAK